jgi:hypothetical protein
MEQPPSDFARQAATTIGDSVEKTSAFIVDQVEGLSLWMMEQAAENYPNSENLEPISDIVHSLRKVLTHVPRLAGSLAAGSTFIGLRLGRGTWKAMTKAVEAPRRDA